MRYIFFGVAVWATLVLVGMALQTTPQAPAVVSAPSAPSAPVLPASLQVHDWDAAAVARRVKALQPTAKETSWEQLAWCRNPAQAVRLAKRLHRPIYMFCSIGSLYNGRC